MRKPRAPLTGAERAARIRILKQIVQAGGTTSDFCEATGMTFDNAANWLRRNAPYERAQLQANRRHGPLPQQRVARGLISM